MTRKATLTTFVTDSGFLVPSLVAALDLVRFGVDRISDIRIYLADIDEETMIHLKRDFGPRNISFRTLDVIHENLGEKQRYFNRHISATSMGRLLLANVLEPQYRNILYLDGDIRIVRDPSRLVSTPFEEGFVYAARGGLRMRPLEEAIRIDHFTQLCIDPVEYFNAGVFGMARATLEQEGERTLEFFLANPEICRLYDQSALNHVFKGRVREISPAYNYDGFFERHNAYKIVEPIIFHFAGPEKPWKSLQSPWTDRFQNDYLNIVEAHPYLRKHLQIARFALKERLWARWFQMRHRAQNEAGIAYVHRELRKLVKSGALCVT